MTVPLGFFIATSATRPKLLALIALLMLFSIFGNQYMHFFFPEPWSKSLNPIFDTALPMMLADLCAPNLLTVHLGWSMTHSAIALLHFSTDHRPGWLFLLLVIGNCGLFWLLMMGDQTDVSVQKDWINLVKLWQGREPGYHE